MKRLISSLLVGSILGSSLAFADGVTPTPTINNVNTPVDAPSAIITGSTEPNALVEIIGGASIIAPRNAESDGDFSVMVDLAQEMDNVFRITATAEGMDRSEAAEVLITEGVQAALDFEAIGGDDRRAPANPVLTEEFVETDLDSYEITGTGEEWASIFVNGSDSEENVDGDGNFNVEVDLEEAEVNYFYLALRDEAGNISGTSKITVTHTGPADVEEYDAPVFRDTTNHWARDYIDALYELNPENPIIEGFPDGFRPDENITRGALLKIALLAFDVNVDEEEVSAVRPFNDVPKDDWTARYVDRGYELGIVEGEVSANGKAFRPHASINRAAAVKILLKAAGVDQREDFKSFLSTMDDDGIFGDIPREAWFAKYAKYMKHKGWIQGYTNGEFGGERFITRAEVAKIVMEIVEFLESSEGEDTPDVEDVVEDVEDDELIDG